MEAGFECKFVVVPPNTLPFECPICQFVLREPYQVTCCHKSFCKVCIRRLKAESKPCPVCQVVKYDLFHDVFLHQTLCEYRVYCPHKSKGCRWSGEIRDLERHLNCDPPADKVLEGCPYTLIECPLIYIARLRRRALPVLLKEESLHMKKELLHMKGPLPVNEGPLPVKEGPLPVKEGPLPVKEESLPVKEGPLSVKEESLPVKEGPLPVKEELLPVKEGLLQVKEESLLVKEGPLPVKEESLPVKEGLLQVKEESLRSRSLPLLLKEGKSTSSSLEKKVQDLQITLISQERRFSDSPQEIEFGSESKLLASRLAVPIELVMTDFEKHKKCGDVWFSPEFSTHRKGYKMCLAVHANGLADGKGRYVSLYVHLVQGEFDDKLEWPFRGSVLVQLVSLDKEEEDEGEEEEGGEPHTKVILFDETSGECTAGRVVDGERAETGQGLSKFVSHKDVQSKFLDDDCLKIRLVISRLT